MFYEGKIYRPPSEASSLILQVTVGCRHNQCSFCSMYKEKQFRIKSKEEIMDIIRQGAQDYPNVERIFLADGDALTVETDLLVDIIREGKKRFPRLERISIYGSPKDILNKPLEELRRLHQEGLGMVYLGVESGSASVLKEIRKGVTPEEMIEAGQRVVASGMQLSCTVILGLGSKEGSEEHALATAKVISAINPHYLGALTLMVEPQAPLYKQVKEGRFVLLAPWEALQELQLMVQHLSLKDCVFRSNHASNYLPLKANLPSEKEALLQVLSEVIAQKKEDHLRPETWRGL